MQQIVYLERDALVADLRRPAFEHLWTEYAATAPERVVERLAGATMAIINKAPLTAATVDALPGLKMIAVAATGTNTVDLEACRARGIVVSNVRGYARHTVPEHVMALLLALSRNLMAWRDSLQAGAWQDSGRWCLFDHPIRDLHGATLGVIGSGSLGEGVVRLAEAAYEKYGFNDFISRPTTPLFKLTTSSSSSSSNWFDTVNFLLQGTINPSLDVVNVLINSVLVEQ